ncbi:hypothetical protein [Chryseolinea lacunae]|uniref:Uncharacterized protein n=1 Tax=Chryseolinea lacunae TaxID=2801331 RepID=A0ABS1KTD9_9BACT|nr:hypothetical protein [Chryseolinea lacunae]MBL0742532.1 hypothetical protein [Chryseolinea lacunae]
MDTFRILGNACFDHVADQQLLPHLDKRTYDSSLLSFAVNHSLPLRNYLVLTHCPEKMRTPVGTLELLVNRYYWLKKFTFHYDGHPEKYKQFEIHTVAIVDTIAKDYSDFDWDVIQHIQLQIRKGSNALECNLHSGAGQTFKKKS